VGGVRRLAMPVLCAPAADLDRKREYGEVLKVLEAR
jgi:hypothetical protein